jgi:hypothetical protein
MVTGGTTIESILGTFNKDTRRRSSVDIKDLIEKPSSQCALLRGGIRSSFKAEQTALASDDW